VAPAGSRPLPPVIFREYDIRGTVGDQLTGEAAYAIGRAFATFAAQRLGRPPRLAVGRDNRPSGTELMDRVLAGIEDAGATPLSVGVVPTPALYFATHTLRVDGGLQVTGSHNPPEFNGFKMVLAGDAVYGEAIQQLRHLTAVGGAPAPARRGGGRESDDTLLARYRDAIVQRNAPLARPVKVVVDCGNGVTSLVAVETLERVGATVIPLFAESDGTFPNHHPDPTVVENLRDLQAAVRREGAELGVGFDGDGDRIGAVDEQGRVVFGDQLLILFARDLVRRQAKGEEGKGKGTARSSVIFDVKCSEVLAQELKRAGLEPVMWKTGHSLIKQKMKDLGAPLAGEMSGHMFFGGDWYGFDDALFAAARLLHFLAAQQGPLSRLLADLPVTVSTPEIRFACPDDRKFEIVEAAGRHFGARYPVSRLDGVRITFPDGWGLLRASNTQPVLVMRFEATREASLAANRREVETWLASAGASP
jgi:phosphomannomutase/phosphoglucomutase